MDEPPAPLVLVVDDDPEIAGLVSDVLVGEGVRVVTASNGVEALASVAERLPALILLDMRMPVLDGWGFAREFRARYGRAAPIVVLTAAENPAQRARDIDADAWLAKPFGVDELLDAVRARLSPGPGRGAAG